MTQSQVNVDVLNGYNKEQVKVVAAVLIDPVTGIPRSNTVTQNISTKFREAFQTFIPDDRWNVVTQEGDIIMLDGNAAAASYLVISKNPLVAGTISTLTSIPTLDMPMELSIGMSMSQRTVGQEFAIELVSDEALITPTPEATIASISQTTTVLTVNTLLPHSLVPGQRIGIMGVSDSRVNYPSLVVASTPSPTQFTATSTPAGALPSITAGPFTTGTVYLRSSMGYAPNGTSLILENNSATNASFYVRAEAGDSLPSGTLLGSHSATIGSTASVQAAGQAANTYSFQPTSEYRLSMFVDGIQWSSLGVDSLAAPSNAYKRTQVVPNPSKDYKLRVRATNNKALTIPVAQIVSVSKTGSTTATITTDVPHGLTAVDWIIAYGARDQVNFANLVVATAIASIVSPTQFTVVWGASVTATTFGGFIARVQGGNLGSALGYNAIVASSVTVSATGIISLTGSGTWAGVLIGDLVNLVGVRNAVTGETLNLDGVYRVRNMVTTVMDLEPVGNTPIPAALASTNCGGGLIKRTDLRLSFVRALDFERQRIEIMPRPQGDVSSAAPVNVQNIPAVTLNSGTLTTVTTVTSVTAANLGLPGTVVDVASAAITSTATLAAVTPTFGVAYEVNIPVTAVTGTTPTMDVDIQESDDAGTNWFTVYSFPRITTTGMYRSPKLPLTGNRVRYVQTISGGTPSFTRSINRLQVNDKATSFRQLINRSVSLTTLNAVTPSLDIQQCRNVQLVLNLGVSTTPPQLQLEGSDDSGLSWYTIGAPLVGVSAATVQQTVANVTSQLIRARVSTVGATVIAGYTLLKGF